MNLTPFLAVYESQYSLYQIYQDAGLEGISSVVASGALGPKSSKWVQDVSNAYSDYNLASKDVVGSDAYMRHVSGYLNNMAQYEQRIILQPFYDRVYLANEIATTPGDGMGLVPASARYSQVAESLGYALNDLPRMPWIANPTTVNVVGTSVSFNGANIADPDQRMAFVGTVANTFMQAYSAPGGISQTIAWLNSNNHQHSLVLRAFE